MDIARSAMLEESSFTLTRVGLHIWLIYASARPCLKVNTDQFFRNLWVSHQGVNRRLSPTVTN